MHMAHHRRAVDREPFGQLIDRPASPSSLHEHLDLSLGQPDLALANGAEMHRLVRSSVNYLS